MIIYSIDFLNHVRHLDVVFKILHEKALYLNGSKCHFAQECLEYMGHMVSAEG